MTEVFETTREENPNSMNKIFSQKRMNYQLKTINFISYPKGTGSNTALISLGSAPVNLRIKSQILLKVHPRQNSSKQTCWKAGKWLNIHAACARRQKEVNKILQFWFCNGNSTDTRESKLRVLQWVETLILIYFLYNFEVCFKLFITYNVFKPLFVGPIHKISHLKQA